jgi:hypothetical protein
MSSTDDDGTLVALLERFRLQRLPAALEIKARVSTGEKLTEHDIQFLEQVFEDVRDVQPLLERHPELKKLAGQAAALYKEITDAALANEHRI